MEQPHMQHRIAAHPDEAVQVKDPALAAPSLLVLEGPQSLASRLLPRLQVCLPLLLRLCLRMALQHSCEG